MNPESDIPVVTSKTKPWIKKLKSLEWIGQTIASISWICSVFLYGISSSGDWLQLVAGFAWFTANIASLYEAYLSDK